MNILDPQYRRYILCTKRADYMNGVPNLSTSLFPLLTSVCGVYVQCGPKDRPLVNPQFAVVKDNTILSFQMRISAQQYE